MLLRSPSASAHQQSNQQAPEAPHLFRRDAASPPKADTAEWDYFTLRERLITMQKQLKEPRSAMNRHCIPGLTMSTVPDGELLWWECPGILKTMHRFSARTRIALA
ncbi:hypothetical protein CEXT_415401 [Caerostris extrusa]|uniref:Uncharacterized protein n=1 Tax=Caerostris extrusa TaxID=172846 RepID=A0AAV4U3V4_CAEEX|nr:hypothetical protein CEXT_415401 [Caerostris extrusa]